MKEKLARDAEARAEGREAAVPRIAPAPALPTEAERKAQVTHTPSKPWFDLRVLGKAAKRGHRACMEPEAAAGAPVVQMEYAYLSTEGELTTELSNAWATTLAMVHVGTGVQFSAAIETK